ncbi:MAG: hypothetical protein AB8G05_04760 [Oligoflexales bacterium]
MHKLLSQQIKRASGEEKVNYDKLLEMVNLTYSEIDEAKKSTDRDYATLESEIKNLNEKITEAKEISERRIARLSAEEKIPSLRKADLV